MTNFYDKPVAPAKVAKLEMESNLPFVEQVAEEVAIGEAPVEGAVDVDLPPAEEKVYIFETEYGQVSFEENPSPRFIFFNPSGGLKPEMTVFEKPTGAMAYFLPAAQKAALGAVFEDAVAVEEGTYDGLLFYPDDGKEFFSKVLSNFASDSRKFQSRLVVSAFEGKAYIYFRNYIQGEADTADENKWFPCVQNFRWSVNDRADAFVKFVESHLIKGKNRKAYIAAAKQAKAAAALKAALFAPAR